MGTKMFRLKNGGLINRGKILNFSFNGKKLYGYEGDTLASALLANGKHLVGRSFKYHRPRGIFSAGSEEPSALIQLGSGAHTEPNIRATTVPLFNNLMVTSQNHFGPLEWDLMRINDFLSPFLGAGFYYKTFMWPPPFWEVITVSQIGVWRLQQADGQQAAARAKAVIRLRHRLEASAR